MSDNEELRRLHMLASRTLTDLHSHPEWSGTTYCLRCRDEREQQEARKKLALRVGPLLDDLAAAEQREADLVKERDEQVEQTADALDLLDKRTAENQKLKEALAVIRDVNINPKYAGEHSDEVVRACVCIAASALTKKEPSDAH